MTKPVNVGSKAPIRIGRRTVEKLAPEPGRYIVWDTELPGFGVRIGVGGARTYLLQYRVPGFGRSQPARKLTLGRHGQITADQARDLAQESLAKVRAGGDPARERRALQSRPVVTDLIRMYLTWLKRHRKPRSLEDAQAILEGHVRPAIGHMAVADVRRRDVAAIVARLETAGHGRAGGKVVQYCRAAFNKAELDESPWFQMRQPGTNPCLRMAVNAGVRRQRHLSTAELGALGPALRTARAQGENPWLLGAIWLWLATGARLREILLARWEWVDWTEGLLRLPTSKTGPKTVTLSPLALAVLERIPHLDGNPYIICGTRSGSPMINPYKGFARIMALAGIQGVRPHDFRRTYASVGLGSGLSLEQLGALLGHSRAETTKGYAFLQSDPARRTAALIGEGIKALLEGKSDE